MNFFKTLAFSLPLALAASGPVLAGQFTTAAEVRPMLDATKSGWISVREYDGKDLLYFTNLLAWRCGLDDIRYSVNGGAETEWDGEPCYDGEAVPNAQKATDKLPYISLPPGSVKTVTVKITYDDGKTDEASYQRADIMTP